MAFFNWEDKFTVGKKEFDDHHKRLFVLINQLYEAMHAGKGQEELQKILNNLFDYTVFHFSSEEKLLLQNGYPEYQKQLAQHEAFKAKIIDYRTKLAKGQIGLSLQVATFLKDWLLNHILVEDKKYEAFLKAKGLA